MLSRLSRIRKIESKKINRLRKERDLVKSKPILFSIAIDRNLTLRFPQTKVLWHELVLTFTSETP